MQKPVFFLLLSAILWSTGGLLIKTVECDALVLAGSRSAIAAVTIYLLMPRRRLRFRPIHWASGLIYVAVVVLFVVANRLTTAANAIFLQYTAPIYIALFGAAWLGERPTRLDWVLIVLTQIGIGLFFLDRLTFGGWWGNLCALASGVAYAGVTMVLRKDKDGSPVENVLAGNILTAVLCLPFTAMAWPSATSWLGLIVLGVFQLGIPYWMYATALKEVRALEASLICMIEPILNPLWVLLFLGERPQPWALAGGTLVLVSAAARGVMTLKHSRTTELMVPVPTGSSDWADRNAALRK